ncbi:NnrS family protein [Chromobacterium alkanivorans]|uniref:NnrS family protein n=1 Tax=Chromobacterium alkanivorans TaxID=1071719 RepID=UPI0019682485|nr:NnrS family protein [Chromobacterium alkanivorans]MBN3006638.1 NnrS family protein [Chromobacterium alkanivorans]
MKHLRPAAMLAQAPHRAAFLPGMLFAILLLAAWSAELASRLLGVHAALAVPSSLAHGFLMLFGFFPLFMTGFLFTAGPRWLGVEPPGRLIFVGVPALMVVGLLLWLTGLWLGLAWTLAGHIMYTLGFSGLALTFACLLLASPQPDRRHACAVLAALFCGALALLAGAYWLIFQDGQAWLWMRNLALWGFLLPVFLSVSHRMLPFFSANALPQYQPWRPGWLLAALLAGSLGHGLLDGFGLPSWPLDAAMAVLLTYVSWRWRLAAALRVRLLGMLHLAFAWLPVGFGLYALNGWLASPRLALAALHALTVGFFLTMMIAFVSRVTLGHSGQALQAGPGLWRLYLAAHWLALTRVATEMLPGVWSGWLYGAAAIGWLLTLAAWGRAFLPSYWRPRSDGKPG